MIEHRILDFLDGRLELHDEEELLHTLAVSPEQRGLLRDHLRLRELSHALSGHSELVTPCATTAGLFVKLADQGFSGPTPLPISTPAPSMPVLPVATPTSIFAGRTALVAAGVVLAFVAGLSVSLFNGGVNRLFSGRVASGNMALFEPQSPQFAELNLRRGVAYSTANLGLAAKGTVDRPLASLRKGGSSERTRSGISRTNVVANGVIASSELSSAVPTSDRNPEPVQPVSSQATVSLVTPEKAASNQSASNRVASPSNDQLTNKQQVPILYYADDASLTSTSPISLSVRTGAGPVAGGSLNYFNSLSEAKLSWRPVTWLVAKASLGEMASHELVGTDLGKNADGLRLIGTTRTLNFIPMGSLELGVVVPFFGKEFELAGGVGSDGNGVVYPRASLFTSFRLMSNLSMMLGVEALTYTHNIASSVSAKQQVFVGQNSAVLDHLTSERSGFVGPSIEFSWRP